MRKGKNKLTLTIAFRNGSSEKKELLTKSVLSALVVGTAFTAVLGATSTVSAVEQEHKVADVNNRIAMYMTDSDKVDATATTTDAIAIGNGAAATTYGTIAIGANTGGISTDNEEKQASTAKMLFILVMKPVRVHPVRQWWRLVPMPVIICPVVVR